MEAVEKNSLELIDCLESADIYDTKKSLIVEYINRIETDDTVHRIQDSSKIFEGLQYVNYASDVRMHDLSGRLVLLDFFTYCCINCIHIMPALHELESLFSISDAMLVIGIHSAKFQNEKVEENIRKAIERYGITHPVINDPELDIWNQFSVKCWPTLIMISPSGKLLFSLAGESHMRFVKLFVECAISFYESTEQILKKGLSLTPTECLVETDGPVEGLDLKFPGKIAVDENGERIAISDSGHNRILISDVEGNVSQIVGGVTPGFLDGEFEKARFSSPQGVCWYGGNTIFVADCNNHAVRKIDLLVKKVITVCGTGLQGDDRNGGNQGIDQNIDSPWDVAIGGSPRVAGGRSLLYIAMSGCHQIWTLALQKTDFQKGSEIDMGTCIRYAGSGKEENKNNAYPHKAGFAQPSGLSYSESEHALYIADSESSTIRKMLLKNGAVQGLVGGDIDPTNLFAYGDTDGTGRNAKLQHPIGVQWDSVRNLLYIADTYNHKLKIVEPKKKSCVTMEGSKGKNGFSLFSEPSGLAIDPSCKFLYVADTNNHGIKVVSLDDYGIRELSLKLHIDLSSRKMIPSQIKLLTGETTVPKLFNSHACSIHQMINISLAYGDLKLDKEAPSSWQVSSQSSENEKFYIISSGRFDKETTTSIKFKLSDIVREKCQSNYEYTVGDVVKVYVESILYYCVGDMCKMLRYKAIIPFEIISKESLSNPLPIRIDIS